MLMKLQDRDRLFRETIRAEARGYHKLKKQTGGPGQFAIVDLRIRPLARGGGFRFVNSVVEGRIPEEFMPSLEKGTREALLKGVLAGFPVIDLEVDVIDGERHRRDSHGRDFQIAGRSAVQDAIRAASPALLEPVAVVEISCPRPALGSIIGLVKSRRGTIRGNDFRDGCQLLNAEIPFLEATAFETDLRSLTSGIGSMAVLGSTAEMVPDRLLARILEQIRKARS